METEVLILIVAQIISCLAFQKSVVINEPCNEDQQYSLGLNDQLYITVNGDKFFEKACGISLIANDDKFQCSNLCISIASYQIQTCDLRLSIYDTGVWKFGTASPAVLGQCNNQLTRKDWCSTGNQANIRLENTVGTWATMVGKYDFEIIAVSRCSTTQTAAVPYKVSEKESSGPDQNTLILIGAILSCVIICMAMFIMFLVWYIKRQAILSHQSANSLPRSISQGKGTSQTRSGTSKDRLFSLTKVPTAYPGVSHKAILSHQSANSLPRSISQGKVTSQTRSGTSKGRLFSLTKVSTVYQGVSLKVKVPDRQGQVHQRQAILSHQSVNSLPRSISQGKGTSQTRSGTSKDRLFSLTKVPTVYLGVSHKVRLPVRQGQVHQKAGYSLSPKCQQPTKEYLTSVNSLPRSISQGKVTSQTRSGTSKDRLFSLTKVPTVYLGVSHKVRLPLRQGQVHQKQAILSPKCQQSTKEYLTRSISQGKGTRQTRSGTSKRQAVLSHQSANSLPRSISQGKGTSQTRSGTSKDRLFSLTKVPTAYLGVSHKVRLPVRQGQVHQKTDYSLSPKCQQPTQEYLTSANSRPRSISQGKGTSQTRSGTSKDRLFSLTKVPTAYPGVSHKVRVSVRQGLVHQKTDYSLSPKCQQPTQEYLTRLFSLTKVSTVYLGVSHKVRVPVRQGLVHQKTGYSFSPSVNSLPRSISQGKVTSQTRSGTSKGRLFSLTKVPTAYQGVSHKVRVPVRQGLVHQKAGYSLSPKCQQLTKEYLTSANSLPRSISQVKGTRQTRSGTSKDRLFSLTKVPTVYPGVSHKVRVQVRQGLVHQKAGYSLSPKCQQSTIRSISQGKGTSQTRSGPSKSRLFSLTKVPTVYPGVSHKVRVQVRQGLVHQKAGYSLSPKCQQSTQEYLTRYQTDKVWYIKRQAILSHQSANSLPRSISQGKGTSQTRSGTSKGRLSSLTKVPTAYQGVSHKVRVPFSPPVRQGLVHQKAGYSLSPSANSLPRSISQGKGTSQTRSGTSKDRLFSLTKVPTAYPGVSHKVRVPVRQGLVHQKAGYSLSPKCQQLTQEYLTRYQTDKVWYIKRQAVLSHQSANSLPRSISQGKGTSQTRSGTSKDRLFSLTKVPTAYLGVSHKVRLPVRQGQVHQKTDYSLLSKVPTAYPGVSNKAILFTKVSTAYPGVSNKVRVPVRQGQGTSKDRLFSLTKVPTVYQGVSHKVRVPVRQGQVPQKTGLFSLTKVPTAYPGVSHKAILSHQSANSLPRSISQGKVTSQTRSGTSKGRLFSLTKVPTAYQGVSHKVRVPVRQGLVHQKAGYSLSPKCQQLTKEYLTSANSLPRSISQGKGTRQTRSGTSKDRLFFLTKVPTAYLGVSHKAILSHQSANSLPRSISQGKGTSQTRSGTSKDRLFSLTKVPTAYQGVSHKAILSHQSVNSLPRSISQGKGISQTRSGTSKSRLFSLTKVPTVYPGVSHKVRVQVRQGLVHQKQAILSHQSANSLPRSISQGSAVYHAVQETCDGHVPSEPVQVTDKMLTDEDPSHRVWNQPQPTAPPVEEDCSKERPPSYHETCIPPNYENTSPQNRGREIV
ncbi:unnamed protein product [Mytilus edulis]|uniref:Uncharacterized protein n=1 Tax=Mytilus edulis TaxID=6550 RepID=A0A8S3VED5_MYTED|nr:unnamed protein product [Mytilus edulis]